MNSEKNNDFHQPFIKSLLVVALVTIVSIVFSNYLVNYYMGHSLKTPIFTSEKFHFSSESSH